MASLSLCIVGGKFENTIRLNTEVIVGERGSQARGYGKSFNLAPRSNNKADGGAANGDIAFSGFIASAICRATHAVDPEIISLLSEGAKRRSVHCELLPSFRQFTRLYPRVDVRDSAPLCGPRNDYLHVDVKTQHL